MIIKTHFILTVHSVGSHITGQFDADGSDGLMVLAQA
jgi:hypothetical protein